MRLIFLHTLVQNIKDNIVYKATEILKILIDKLLQIENKYKSITKQC